MYNSPELAIAIKETAKSKGIIIGDMLKSCGLGVNTISHLNHGKALAFDSVAKIADYLGVSVDYLLGREQQPQTSTTTTNNNNNNNNNHSQFDETTLQVAEEFRKLDFKDKIQVMSLIAELSEKKGA